MNDREKPSPFSPGSMLNEVPEGLPPWPGPANEGERRRDLVRRATRIRRKDAMAFGLAVAIATASLVLTAAWVAWSLGVGR